MIPEPLTVSESQFCDSNKERIEKEVEDFNARAGNKSDEYDCPICKNRRLIAFAEKSSVYNDWIMRTTSCQCVKKIESKKQAKESGLGDLLNLRVNGFKAIEDWQKDLKQLVVDYIQNGGDHWLALLGSSGAGKTHLCATVSNALLEKTQVRYEVWPSMMKNLKKDVFSQNGTKEMLNDLMNIPVLYIDDLFKGVVTDQDVSLMFDLLNHRYNTERITIITSEWLMEDLAKIDVAIAGRIKERCGKYLRQIVGSEKNYRFRS